MKKVFYRRKSIIFYCSMNLLILSVTITALFFSDSLSKVFTTILLFFFDTIIIYEVIGKWFLRIVVVKNGMLIVHRDLTLFMARQHKAIINIFEIDKISFEIVEGNSRGVPMGWVACTNDMRYSECLIVTQKNGKIDKILLSKYNIKLCEELEKCILTINKNIIVEKHPRDLKNNSHRYKKQ